jgi:hypothetical protein
VKRSGTYYKLLLLIFTCSGLVSKAQTLKASVDRDRILIGEQIRLTLRLEGIQSATGSVNNWVNFPDTVNHLEVVERGKIDTLEVGSDVILQQAIILTSFDSGQWQIPALGLAIQNGTGKTLSYQPITIDVLPVDVSALKDYHDIKDIVQVDDSLSKLILIGIIVLTIISIIAVYLLAKKKSGFTAEAKPVLKGNQTPLEWALAALENLRKENLPSKGQVKQYYQQLTDICREYFQLQLKQKVLHQTSDEWMLKMHSLPVNQSTKTSFFQFIRLADTVKFAKYIPPSSEHEPSMQMAKQMLVEVAKSQQTTSLTNKTTLA